MFPLCGAHVLRFMLQWPLQAASGMNYDCVPVTDARHSVLMQVSGAYADMGMTEWLFIISADRSNSPAGLPGSQFQFLSLFAMDSVAMIMNTNLSSDCVRLCLSVLLKIAEALCQSSTVSWIVSNRLSKTVFVFAQFKEWPAFCPLSRLSCGAQSLWNHLMNVYCFLALLSPSAKLKWWLHF